MPPRAKRTAPGAAPVQIHAPGAPALAPVSAVAPAANDAATTPHSQTIPALAPAVVAPPVAPPVAPAPAAAPVAQATIGQPAAAPAPPAYGFFEKADLPLGVEVVNDAPAAPVITKPPPKRKRPKREGAGADGRRIARFD